MTLSLRTRLTLLCATTFAILLGLIGATSYRLLARQLDVDEMAHLTQLTAGLHGYLRFEGEHPTMAFDDSDTDQVAFVHDATRYYQIYDAHNGRLLAQSDGLEALGLHFTSDEVQAFLGEPRTYDIDTAYGRFRLSNSVISPAAGQRYLLQVGTPLDPMHNALGRYLELLLWIVLPSLIVALGAIWWIVGAALAPLSQLAADARRIGIGTLDRRLPVRGGGDQLDEVATAFNDTLVRLEAAVGEMRQFSAALAHELRTPLAALRGEIELSLLQRRWPPEQQSALTSQIEEIDKLTRLIHQLLTLARADAGDIPVARQTVDLVAVAAAVTEHLEPVAQSRDLQLRFEAREPVSVAGDGGWLERLLLNLLDNAMKFTPKGGSVSLSISREGDRAGIEVRDTGIGMPADVVPHIFERFYRADTARSSAREGAGLGLSLVRWIVDRHQGRIQVASHPGKGSTFTIWLPLDGSPP